MRSLLAALLLLAATPAAAATAMVPSCYAFSKVGLISAPPSRGLFLLVDQTTPIDGTVKQAIKDNILPLLMPGASFTIVTFSAFAQGRFETPIASGVLETPMLPQQRGDVSVPALRKLDGCLVQQRRFARDLASAAIDKAVAGQSDALAHSEIVSSLAGMAPRIAASPRRDRILIVASDMLENSALTSFYAHRTVRRLDTTREMKAVADFIPDFKGARAYVIGAGTLPAAASATRDPASMRSLELFWTAWFRASNARLVEFGKPMLTQSVR